MEIQQNMAAVIRMIMEARNMTIEEFSAELQISRSMLQEYLKGRGNPSIKTIIHLAEKMEIEPILLLTGVELEMRDVVLPLLNTLQNVSGLSSTKKFRFAELLLEMVHLWDEEP